MAPNVLFYQLLLVALVLLCLIMHIWWPDNPRAALQTPRQSDKPQRKRSNEPKPFTGFIHKPLCEACEKGTDILPKGARLATSSTHLHPRPQAYRQHTCALLSEAKLFLPWLARTW